MGEQVGAMQRQAAAGVEPSKVFCAWFGAGDVRCGWHWLVGGGR
jgi:hypothetical protein